MLCGIKANDIEGCAVLLCETIKDNETIKNKNENLFHATLKVTVYMGF